MTDIAYTLRPKRSLLFVREDEVKNRTAGGIFMPEDSSVPWTGVILDKGPWVSDEDFAVGQRVMWRPRTGMLVGHEGTSKEGTMRILNEDQILGLLDLKDPLSVPSSEWLGVIQARPGRLLVERVEMPIVRGGIILPDGAKVHVRSQEVIVRSVGKGVEGYAVGDRCLIHHMVGDVIELGDRGEIKLWSVREDSFVADVLVDEESLRLYGEDPAANLDFVLTMRQDEELVYDEGDPRGLR